MTRSHQPSTFSSRARTDTHAACITALLVLCISIAPSARQDRPAAPGQTPSTPQLTFRVETNFIEVDAVVTDGRGAFVRDLKREDFAVFEDGKPQKLDAFALIDIPLERVDRPLYREDAVDPDVFTNERDFEGRIYLIVLDSYHVAPIRTTQAKRVARDFVLDHMAANDSAAVVHVGRTDVSQEFTSNKRLLLSSIDKFMGQKLRSKVLNKFDNVQVAAASDQPPQDHDWPERIGMARATVESLGKLSGYMTGIQGRRKAVLFVSEGLDFDVDDVIGAPRLAQATDPYGLASNSSQEASDVQAVAREMQVTLEAATRGNVAVYAVDPRGLTDASEELIAVPGRVEIADSPAADVPVKALGEEIRRSQGMLRTLSNQTGASAITSTNNFADGFGRIVQDNSTYYMLGYHGQPKNDGKFHDLTVKVTRPGLQVRARKGYWAYTAEDAERASAPAKPSAPRDVMTALDDLADVVEPASRKPVIVWMGASRGAAEGGKATVTLAWEPSPGTPDPNEVVDRINVTATSVYGDVVFRGPVPRDAQTGRPGGTVTFEAPPGEVRARIVAENARGMRLDTSDAAVDVPDFTKPGPTISTPIVFRGRTARDIQVIRAAATPVPSASRLFSRTERILVRFDAYGPGGTTPTIVMRLLNRNGEQMAALPSPAAGATPASFQAEFGLGSLPPGDYLIEIAATSGTDTTRKLLAIRVTG